MKAKGLICKSIMVVLFMLCTNDAINAQIKIDGFAINPKLGACKTEYEAFIFGGEFNEQNHSDHGCLKRHWKINRQVLSLKRLECCCNHAHPRARDGACQS